MLITESLAESQNWFCLRTQARREHIAAANLRERVAVEVFSPRVRKILNTSKGLLSATEALFPGYVFARFNFRDQMRHIVSTCGVTGIVGFGGHIPPVADRVIDYLRSEVAAVHGTSSAPLLEEGSWVRILSGCFRYIEGRVLHFDPRAQRVQILLALLGTEVQVTVSTERVALLSESRPLYPVGLMLTPGEHAPPAPSVV